MDLLTQFGGTVRKFSFDVFNETLHLVLHFFQPLPHVENDLNSSKIDTEISGEIQNQFETLEIFLSV